MQTVIPGLLWQGNAHDARNFEILFDLEIEAIVDLAMEEQPVAPPRDFQYFRIPLIDGQGNPPGALRTAVHCVVRLMDEHVPMIVACSAGLSRSPAIVAAALATHWNEDLHEGLQQVVKVCNVQIMPSLWQEVCDAVQLDE